MHLLIGHDFKWPEGGDVVQGTFEGGAFGAVKVPDMAAIPIHHVAELPLDVEGRIGELRVTAVPVDRRNDRDYFFEFLRFATPLAEYKGMFAMELGLGKGKRLEASE